MDLISEFQVSDVFILAVVEIYIALGGMAPRKIKLIKTLKGLFSLFEKFLERKALDQDGEPVWDRMHKLSINFKEILRRAYEKFENQNTVLESPIIITNCCITIIINVFYY